MVTHELKHRVCQISVSIVQKLVPRVGAICIGAKEKLGVTQRRCYVSEDQRFLPLAAPHASTHARAQGQGFQFRANPSSFRSSHSNRKLPHSCGRKKERENRVALSALWLCDSANKRFSHCACWVTLQESRLLKHSFCVIILSKPCPTIVRLNIT